jgi:plastocyanin
MVRPLAALVLLALWAAEACAAPLTVRVLDAKGRPVRDAVVTLRPAAGAQRPTVGGTYVVSQEDMQFHPFVLVVPVGARVSFPNRDDTRHHVYSFSPAKQFELKLFAKDQSRSVLFDKPGVVPLGCNIHDDMSAFIVVADSAWTAKTGPNGVVQFANAPGTPARLSVWHPFLRARSNIVERPIGPAERSATFTIALRSPPMALSHGY